MQEYPKVTRVRLTRKLALVLNGFDLSRYRVGDEIAAPESVARMLVREGWAEALPQAAGPLGVPAQQPAAPASET